MELRKKGRKIRWERGVTYIGCRSNSWINGENKYQDPSVTVCIVLLLEGKGYHYHYTISYDLKGNVIIPVFRAYLINLGV